MHLHPFLFTTSLYPTVDVDDVDDGDADGGGGHCGEEAVCSSGELPLLPLSFLFLLDSIASVVAMQTISENRS